MFAYLLSGANRKHVYTSYWTYKPGCVNRERYIAKPSANLRLKVVIGVPAGILGSSYVHALPRPPSPTQLRGKKRCGRMVVRAAITSGEDRCARESEDGSSLPSLCGINHSRGMQMGRVTDG